MQIESIRLGFQFIEIESFGLEFAHMETKPNKLDLYVGPTGAFFMLFGHVHIELEPFRLNFFLMEIKSKELDFHEWSLAPPRVACGSQRSLFPPYLSYSVTLSSTALTT